VTGPRFPFAPTVATGVALAALTSVATTRDWLAVHVGAGLVSQDVLNGLREASPLGSALSLVVLAAWGSILVTRRKARQVTALLAATAALALCVVIVVWAADAAESARAALRLGGVAEPDVGFAAWVWLALVGGIGSVALSAAAFLSAPGWPEMGSRYDAPAARRSGPEETDLDAPMEVWKAIDEGRDPTLGPSA
jgi:hypothetical protein